MLIVTAKTDELSAASTVTDEVGADAAAALDEKQTFCFGKGPFNPFSPVIELCSFNKLCPKTYLQGLACYPFCPAS